MKFNPVRLAIFRSVVILAAAGFLSNEVSQAQSQTEEQPALKDFGSSLKQLKWDPGKNAAVETGSREKRLTLPVEDVIRIDTELVVCDVLILDRDGKVVEGLTPKDFVVAEDGLTQQIGHFSFRNNGDIERSIVLIIDYSSSQLPYINSSIAAAKTLVDRLGPRDRMAIVTDDVELLIDYTSDRTRLKYALEDLRQRATLQERFGKSYQFTSLMAPARELFSREDFRRVVIFQTDGDELNLLQPFDLYRFFHLPPPPANASEKEKRKSQERLAQALGNYQPEAKQFSLNDVLNAVERSRATIYSVIPFARFIGVSPTEQLANARNYSVEATVSQNPGLKRQTVIKYLPQSYLLQLVESWTACQSAVSKVAAITGGFSAFLENPAQADEIYSRILRDMDNRYVIGYYPTNKAHDGKRRRVLIEVRNHPEYTVEGRKTYFAPGPDQY